MRILGISILALIGLLSTAIAQTTTFTNVNVIPMDRQAVLTDQLVIVEGMSISAIGSSNELEPPAGSTIIDGRGGYLMPGLADMHMHLVGNRSYRDPEQLLFFLAQGTTTVRVLGAPPIALEWREKVLSGELIGPRIYAMGPTLIGNYDDELGLGSIIMGLNVARIGLPVVLALAIVLAFKRFRSRRSALFAVLSGLVIGGILIVREFPPFNMLNPVFDAPQAHALEDRVEPVGSTIAKYAERGYDGVKMYDGLTEAQFLTAATESKRHKLHSVGHLLNQVPLDIQLASGLREVAHIDEFLSHHWIGYNLGNEPDAQYSKLGNYPIDVSNIPTTVNLVAENDVAVVANLSTDEALYRLLLDLEGTLAEPRFNEFRQDYVQGWKTRGRHFGPFAGQGEYRRDENQPFFLALAKALHEAGVLITTGTDAGGFTPEGSIPSGIHREAELLVEAGLTNFEALAASTRNAGKIISSMTGDIQGTVEVGSKADLVLLTSNPLDNVSATRQRFGVMANGVWYPQSDLDQMVKDYQNAREW